MPLVASNAHILTPLFHTLGKIIKDSKSYVPTVPMITSFKVLKQFFSGKISFSLFPNLWYGDFKPEILMLFSEIFTHTTVGLIEKGLLFPGKMLVCDWYLPYLKVNGI